MSLDEKLRRLDLQAAVEFVFKAFISGALLGVIFIVVRNGSVENGPGSIPPPESVPLSCPEAAALLDDGRGLAPSSGLSRDCSADCSISGDAITCTWKRGAK